MKRSGLSRASILFFSVSLTGGTFFTLLSHATADGGQRPDMPRSTVMVPAESIDRRLPPVLPGQTVTTQDGRKHKVISTVGPVPVNPIVPAPGAPVPPVAPELPQVNVPTGPVSVIIDRREE